MTTWLQDIKTFCKTVGGVEMLKLLDYCAEVEKVTNPYTACSSKGNVGLKDSKYWTHVYQISLWGTLNIKLNSSLFLVLPKSLFYHSKTIKDRDKQNKNGEVLSKVQWFYIKCA